MYLENGVKQISGKKIILLFYTYLVQIDSGIKHQIKSKQIITCIYR